MKNIQYNKMCQTSESNKIKAKKSQSKSSTQIWKQKAPTETRSELITTRVEIPLKNRSRFERFERFSRKI